MAKKILVTVIVLMAFQDKIDHKTQYAPGDELQVDKERAEDLVERGLAKVKVEEPKAPADKKPKKAKEDKEPKTDKPVDTLVPGEEKKEENAAPAGDNPETKQSDDTGTEK